jgi:hypothetical protein
MFQVPAAGRYLFDVELDWISDDPHFAGRAVGGARLEIGGREVLMNRGLVPTAAGDIELTAGSHPFSFVFYKNRPWTNHRAVSLWAEGPGVERHALHDLGATPANVTDPIIVEPGAEAVALRGFVDHATGMRTHAISVGDPSGVHYAYDLAAGALLHAWRGPFLEATDMWHGRGERQLAHPRGSVIDFSGAPALAILPDARTPWPDSAGSAGSFRPLGYAVDERGRPTYRYRIAELEVEDRIRPDESGTVLERELVIRGSGTEGGLFVRVAEGSRIAHLADGSYAVDDNRFYVSPARGTPRPQVRTVTGGEELIVPLQLRQGEARITYSIIW